MIWKEEDVMNLTEGKKAIQSSVSKWSHVDDANRAIDVTLEDVNFAFHTGLEDNPFWMVDLESVYAIDCIRITNRKELKHQKINKNLKVECSLDKENWINFDVSLFEWTDLEVLEINVLQSLKARYIKISLNTRGYLVLRRVEVLQRKYHYAVAGRHDGLGTRIGAIISAMYISKHLNGFKFAFSWLNGTCDDHRGGIGDNENISFCSEILMADEMFSEKFLQEYLISSKYRSHSNDVLNLSFDDPVGRFLKRKWGSFIGKVSPHVYMQNLVPKKVLADLKECYESIRWSDRCAQIIQDVEYICSSIIASDFVILHLRGGEVALGEFRVAPHLWMHTKHFPYEVAIDVAKIEWGRNHIVIIGQDFKSNQILEDYLNQIKPNKDIQIYSVDSLINEHYVYTHPERAFFDMNFLSKAKKIYATGGSQFSNTASMIAGKELVCSFYDIYSDEELYEIIQKNIHCLEIGNLHRAYCYYRLYDFAKKLNKPFDIQCKWLSKAMQEDFENDFYRVVVVDSLFARKDFEEADIYLKTECLNRKLFFEAIYGPHNTMNKWGFPYYDSLRDRYLEFANESYPYISYMAARISVCRRNLDDALKFINYSLEAEPNSQEFLSYQKEIKALLPGQIKQEKKVARQPSPSRSVKFFNKNDTELSSAKVRIQNQLSYKLGQVMILNSKSLFGCVRMPYELFRVIYGYKQDKKAYQEKVKKNPSLRLPPLESCLDYKEALKYKNHLSYRLGEALIQANKTWWKGGYIEFLFRLREIKNGR